MPCAVHLTRKCACARLISIILDSRTLLRHAQKRIALGSRMGKHNFEIFCYVKFSTTFPKYLAKHSKKSNIKITRYISID